MLRQGVENDDIFSPVAHYTSLQRMMAIVAKRSWKMMSLNPEAAFLNGNLDEELFIQQPEGFKIPRKPTPYIGFSRAHTGYIKHRVLGGKCLRKCYRR